MEDRPKFFVITTRRTEWFHTKEAGQFFIELHCDPRRPGNQERLVRTNAIT